MLSFLEKYIPIGFFQVLTVYKTDQEDVFYLLKVLSKKGKLELLNNSKYKNMAELICFLDVKKPLIIIIDGKIVLNKQLNTLDNVDLTWEKNLDLNTFYYTKYTSKDTVFASYVKRDVVDEVVSNFKKLNFEILDLYIGVFLTALLQPILNLENIHTNGLILNFKNNLLENYKKNDEFINKKYLVGGQEIDNWFLPQYGSIIDYKIKSDQVVKSKIKDVDKENYYYKRFFNFFGIFMLVSIFFSLIVSYFTTGYYIKSNATLKGEQIYLNETTAIIKKLEIEKNEKSTLLLESGFLNSEYHYFYAYQILESVPRGIVFDSMEIKPISVLKESKKALISLDVILLSGSFKENVVFNTWFSELKSLKWIKDLTILKFSKDKNQVTQFTIKIKI
jgi:hypothetical protein